MTTRSWPSGVIDPWTYLQRAVHSTGPWAEGPAQGSWVVSVAEASAPSQATIWSLAVAADRSPALLFTLHSAHVSFQPPEGP